jgi:hypothetical protein
MESQLTARRPAAFDALVGSWEMVGSAGGQPLGQARMTFEWIEDGAFLRERGEAGPALPGTPPAWIANSPFPTTAIIGLDDGSGEYSFLHADVRGVRRVYRMTLDEQTWTLRGLTANGYHQRFTGIFGPRQTSIAAKWESSPDGLVWHHDFDETYTKLD